MQTYIAKIDLTFALNLAAPGVKEGKVSRGRTRCLYTVYYMEAQAMFVHTARIVNISI